MFKKATKEQAKLRLTFDGPAGAGKTYSSLVLAKTLGGKTALIDTEHRSASKYADIFDFDTAPLDDHSPDEYVRAIRSAGESGYEVLIVDSLSHAWNGRNGALEQVDREKDKFGGGWRKVTPAHNKLVDALLSFPGHLITTMRSKMAYETDKDEKGKTVIRKLGLAPIQREGMEFEFDVVCDLSVDGHIHVSKTRCPPVRNVPFDLEDVPKMGSILLGWLNAGAPPPAVPDVLDNIHASNNREELVGYWGTLNQSLQQNSQVVGAFKEKAASFQG